MARQEAQAIRKPPLPTFDPGTEEGAANLDALGAYIQANGGGPVVPAATGDACAATTRPAAASCSGSTAPRATTSPGAAARCRRASTPRRWTRHRRRQIYAAMLTGPQNMPKFTDRQLTPEEKKDIIAFIKSVEGDYNNPGGYPLGGIGPVSEGLIAFIVGLAGLIGFALWLGAKS